MIKWSGLDENGDPWNNTWEPAENIEKSAAEAVKKFWKKRKASIMENFIPLEKWSGWFSSLGLRSLSIELL